MKYGTIVWNEGQRNIPLEWVSCFYKVVPNCADRANSTHPSRLSDAQMEPKCDLNYWQHSLMLQYFRAKVIKHGNKFFFKKSNLYQSIFLAAVPLSREKSFSLVWEPSLSHHLSHTALKLMREPGLVSGQLGEWRGWHLSWHRPLCASVGAREPLTSATWEKWSR